MNSTNPNPKWSDPWDISSDDNNASSIINNTESVFLYSTKTQDKAKLIAGYGSFKILEITGGNDIVEYRGSSDLLLPGDLVNICPGHPLSPVG